EDARARINILSEMPDDWNSAVLRWSRLNAGKSSSLNGRSVPERNDEYLFYQTLVGAWLPEAGRASGSSPFVERIVAYMLKALREAKAHTSWTHPNLAYEQGTLKFVRDLLTVSSPNRFLDDFKQFHSTISFFGRFNSLAQ